MTKAAIVGYLGIDPGASGGFAIVWDDRSIVTTKFQTDLEDWQWLRDRTAEGMVFAALEKVGGYIGTPQPGSAMFKFGASWGRLRGFLTAASVPFEEPTPQRWQKDLNIAPRRKASKKRGTGESKTDFKRRLRDKAQSLFPYVTITNDIADALLIAEWLKRQKGDR